MTPGAVSADFRVGLGVSRHHATAPTPDRYPRIRVDPMPPAILTGAGVLRAHLEVTDNGAAE
jgi:hypothetical protein